MRIFRAKQSKTRKIYARYHHHRKESRSIAGTATRREVTDVKDNSFTCNKGIRIAFSLQPWHLILCTTLGIVLFGIGVYHYYEKQMVMYEQQLKYENQIGMCKKQMDSMEEELTKHKEQMVISYQMNIINIFRLGVCKVQASADQYVAQLKRYCELKDRYRWSLSSQEKDELSQLEVDFELKPDQTIDIHSATSVVRQVCKETSKILSSWLKVLEDALHEMDIEKMRRLQKFMNKTYLDTFFKIQMEEIKIKLAKSSEEFEQRGVLYRISSVLYNLFMPTLTHIVISVANNVIKNMMF